MCRDAAGRATQSLLASVLPVHHFHSGFRYIQLLALQGCQRRKIAMGDVAEVDVTIVGQGLAGSALAWQLTWLGKRVAIVDHNVPTTASRIAAGLISPLTGKRAAVSWRFPELWRCANGFYRRVELETKASFFYPLPLVRLLAEDQQDPGELADRARYVHALSRPLDPQMRGHWKARELRPGARLDVPAYLCATRAAFIQSGRYVEADLRLPEDLEFLPSGQIRVGPGDFVTEQVIFCEGIRGIDNPWFREVVFDAAMGEVLTLRIPSLQQDRVLLHDIWLVPQGEQRFLVGATFNRTADEARTTQKGRAELLGKLERVLESKAEVLDHQAAIRPIVAGRLPCVAVHHRFRQIGFFNGLGSKGALRAPWVARQFAHHLLSGRAVDADIRQRDTKSRTESSPRLTEVAHDAVRCVLRQGDAAVDATAGNGGDTVFLANLVGTDGIVFSLDLQPEALRRTRLRLQQEGISNVALHGRSHAELADIVPDRLVGRIKAVMFNLGYLPGGDKSIVTTPETSEQAVRAALDVLLPGGLVTIVAYTGHPGGIEEARGIEQLLMELPLSDYEVRRPPEPWEAGCPRLYVVTKR